MSDLREELARALLHTVPTIKGGWDTTYRLADAILPIIQRREREAGEKMREASNALADAAAAAIYGLPEMLEANALSDEEGMVRQLEMALASYRRALSVPDILEGKSDG